MFVELKVGDKCLIKSLGDQAEIIDVRDTTYLVSINGTLTEVPKVDVVPIKKDKNSPKNSTKSEQEMVSEFHKAFNYPRSDKPVVLDPDTVLKRISFIQEELIELLAASVDTTDEFDSYLEEYTNQFTEAVFKERSKVQLRERGEVEQSETQRIVDQSDALVDILYFTFGSADISGVQLKPLFDIVQEANMAKLDENGRPIYNEFGKIQKPEGWKEKHAPEPKLYAEVEKQIKDAEGNV